MACNAYIQLTTGYTSSLIGCQARIPVDLIVGSSKTVTTFSTVYITILRKSLTTACNLTRQKMHGYTTAEAKQLYNYKIHDIYSYHIANTKDLK